MEHYVYDDMVVLAAYTRRSINVKGAVIERMKALMRHTRTLTAQLPLDNYMVLEFAETTTRLDTIRLLSCDASELNNYHSPYLPPTDTLIALTDVNTLAPFLPVCTPRMGRIQLDEIVPPGLRRIVLHVRFNDALDWRDESYTYGDLLESLEDFTVILSRAGAWAEPPPIDREDDEVFVPEPAWLAGMAAWILEAWWRKWWDRGWWLETLQPDPAAIKLTIVGLESVDAEWGRVPTSGEGVEAAFRAAVHEKVRRYFLETSWAWAEDYDVDPDVLFQAVSDMVFVERDVYRRAVGPRQWAIEGGED
ncbi:hypothetical protein Q8F55_002974 [Vanrija albida]|uniref:Uncharacterized protein n=1 Tax=Vanrija albida TaxID=181172 RepID=A0ABR3QB87_9TREE